MSNLHSLGIGAFGPLIGVPNTADWVVVQRPLQSILRFTGRSIDDVVNSPVAKNEVIGYFKLQKQIGRRTEIVELEKQWNTLG
jgi:hypothetical protein